MWLIKLIPRLQPFVVLSLFIAFLLVFGLQAFKKYRSYEVYIRETVIETKGLEAPALTICVEGVRKLIDVFLISYSLYFLKT